MKQVKILDYNMTLNENRKNALNNIDCWSAAEVTFSPKAINKRWPMAAPGLLHPMQHSGVPASHIKTSELQPFIHNKSSSVPSYYL